ncbi:hypothetical protein [Vallitalea okinawensis]|uniref:hypothetical protein n=1 Tax=Vallitalea okinawensis TaxID=2078660 RepID=UPI000CFAD10C|nr:hypothetical protein [Vallitalea okinawensis]
MERVNITDLKRITIRKTILNGEYPIEIYNPTTEQQEKILKILLESYQPESKVLTISELDVLKILIPMLTNIYIDTEEDDIVNAILEDPSEMLLEVQSELSDIVGSISRRFVKMMNTLNKLPEHDVKKVLGTNAEKRIITLSEELEKQER